MYDTLIGIGAMGISTAVGATLWYKMGRLEQKIDLIYKNINIAIDWANNNGRKGGR